MIKDLIYGWGNPWSVQEEYIRAFLEYAWRASGPILECGTGLSTLLLGLAAQRTGNRVWSLEHSPAWAERARDALTRYGINSVEVCLTEIVSRGHYSWYAPCNQTLPADFALVVCDGPPGGTHGGRYGLLPEMRRYFRPGCVILLDDAHRAREKATLDRWAGELGSSYTIAGSVKQHAVLCVPSSAPLSS